MQVKSGPFRHLFGEPLKESYHYIDLRLRLPSSDSNNIDVNAKYFAVPYQGGGGMVAVVPQKNFGKVGRIGGVNGHTDPVLDLQFSPFNDDLLATASSDATIKLWSLTEESGYTGPESVLTEPVQSLESHEKKITRILFHPAANNVLASSSVDKRLLLWDIEQQQPQTEVGGFPEPFQDISFNLDGSLMVSTARDKTIRIIDPRVKGDEAVVGEGAGPTGGKPARVVWLKRHDMIFTAGFTRSAERNLALYDPRKLSEGAVHNVNIDHASGIMMPFFDEDTSLMYIAGKGDGNIRTCEVSKTQIFKVGPTGQFASTTPQRGMAAAPKLACDVTHHEVMRLYKVTSDSVVPISFKVPRKTETFQSELYPDTFEPRPAQDAQSFFQGNNAEPHTCSMKPGERPEVDMVKPEFKPVYVKPTPKTSTSTSSNDDSANLRKQVEELQAKNQTLQKQVETLTAENKKYKTEIEEMNHFVSELKSELKHFQDVQQKVEESMEPTPEAEEKEEE